MKIVLAALNAKFIHSCLAVYSLKANAAEYKNDIDIEEYTINQKTDDIVRRLYGLRPEVLAFSCYIWNIEQTMRVVRDIRQLLPATRIWLGGPEAFYNAKNLMAQNAEIDGIMLGEGEAVFLDVLRIYDGKGSTFRETKGICFRQDGKVFHTGQREPLELDSLEFACEDIEPFQNRIIYYESSRGCPFSCSYCLSSIDKKLRFRSMEKIKMELGFFMRLAVPQVKFVDRTFNANKNHAAEIWRYLQEHDNGITNFHFEISADRLNEEQLLILSKMRKGQVQLETGVQTTNPRTLQEIDRKMDLDKVKEATGKIRSYGNIHQHLDLIAGLPYEDYRSFADSFDEIYRLAPDMLQLGFLKVLKGTKMHDNSVNYGIISQSAPPYEVQQTRWISYDEINKLKEVEEALEIYYNSGQFSHSIRGLERVFARPFDMYLRLGSKIREKGPDKKHARSDYYDLFLQTAVEMDPKKEVIYRELLTLDLYIREKMKSRPALAVDRDPFKEQIKEIYRDREKIEPYLKGYESYDTKQIARMTHIEVFGRDIFKYAETAEDDKAQTWILFDYLNKDKISGIALCTKIER